MNNELFAELDFAIRRGNFEKAEQIIAAYKKQYAPGSEEFGELCYYELLTHYKATDISTLKYYFKYNCKSTLTCVFCNYVEEYSNSLRKGQIAYISMSVGRFQSNPSDYIHSTIRSAERCLQEEDYSLAITRFLEANEKKRAAEVAIIAAKAELKKSNFIEASNYLCEVLSDDECYKEYKKVKIYEQVFQSFQKEIGSPHKYAVSVLEKADSDKYHKYLSLANTKGGYTDGVLHFIAVLFATVTSVFMLFDPHLDIPALYVIWGICASVALHKKFLWDFGFVKSIGGTFLLCLIPVLLTAFSDEVLDADGLGAIITVIISLIEFIPTLIRNIKYMNHSKAGKKAVALRTQFIEPTLGKARRLLVEKYSPLTDRETATAWANTINL